jgi:hypothetical protein
MLRHFIEQHLVSTLASGERRKRKESPHSPGRMRRTEVWISRDEMVDFLFCWQVERYVSNRELSRPLQSERDVRKKRASRPPRRCAQRCR